MNKKTSAQRQKEWRERHGIVRTVSVHLTQEQADQYQELLELRKWEGSVAEFNAAALIQGAKFRVNAGGGKKTKTNR